MYLLVINAFISAFLLFQIQPILGKILLPVFGGGASIWSATLLSFQLLLLAGYTYAYIITTRLSLSNQTLIHSFLLILSCAILGFNALYQPAPVFPPTELIASSANWPTLSIVGLIIISVGLPYFVLSSNSTLMQYWLVRRGETNPYWMYSFSNAGSSLALLTYPFVVEPTFGVRMQGWIWSALFIVFVLLTLLITRPRRDNSNNTIKHSNKSTELPVDEALVDRRTVLWWLALSFVPSMMLLAVTAHITQEIAPIPFLWVGPLFFYLLSFILTFSSKKLYSRGIAQVLIPLSIAGLIPIVLGFTVMMSHNVILMLFLFLVVCWYCHGELFTLRPSANQMQLFYVIVATGGALGGIFVSLIAPLIFNRYYEFYIGLFLVGVGFVFLQLSSYKSSGGILKVRAWPGNLSVLLTTCILGTYFYYAYAILIAGRPGYYQRNFYGVIRLAEGGSFGRHDHAFHLYHGIILHGSQLVAPQASKHPLTYYGPKSGVGIALQHLQYRKNLNVGVLGLGVGTMATYGRSGDTYHFFEINPKIRDIALGKYGFFSYLSDSAAKIEIHMGDGRLTIDETIPKNSLDLLLLDAFSSDSIPVHLLTLEAGKIFMSKLKHTGVLAIHISNRHLYLEPNVMSMAKALKIPILELFDTEGQRGQPLIHPSRYVLLSKSAKTLISISRFNPAARVMIPNDKPIGDEDLWTDDYSNVYYALW